MGKLCSIVACCKESLIPALQGRVRDPRAGYEQSLGVLREAKAQGVLTKSSIMLGLGETDDEIVDTLLDLRDAGAPMPQVDATYLSVCNRTMALILDVPHAGVDIVTFGQYLQPTPTHLPVKDFITPEKFEHWRQYGQDTIGFRLVLAVPRHGHSAISRLTMAVYRYVASGPLVRSSYRAGEFFTEAMIRQDRQQALQLA